MDTDSLRLPCVMKSARSKTSLIIIVGIIMSWALLRGAYESY